MAALPVPLGYIDDEAVAERLRQLRQVYDLPTQTAMAVKIDVEFDRYNTAERGKGLSKEVAVRICQKFPGVTLDWLYFGKQDLLPAALANSLSEAPGADAPPSKQTKGGRSGSVKKSSTKTLR